MQFSLNGMKIIEFRESDLSHLSLKHEGWVDLKFLSVTSVLLGLWQHIRLFTQEVTGSNTARFLINMLRILGAEIPLASK